MILIEITLTMEKLILQPRVFFKAEVTVLQDDILTTAAMLDLKLGDEIFNM